MSSFSQLVLPSFRSEIIAGDLADYVVDGMYIHAICQKCADVTYVSEYQKAVDLRGDLSDEPPMFQELRSESSVRGTVMRIISDFPAVITFPAISVSLILITLRRYFARSLPSRIRPP